MEINDINKVASRKRINAEAEKLREKVSRETAKIIKLKVAQDTAYWDLKEKLQQVEANHEKLQQNMVEVQMQHEAISGQYQEELRLRPDTLNKLSSTRAICDVLEDYSERLKDTLSRCKADQTALCEAYQRSGQLVREIKTKQVEAGEKNRTLIDGLEEKVKLMSGHQSQLLQFFTAAKQQADTEIADLRNKLTSTHAHKEELIVAQNELNRKMDQFKFDIEKKEEINANLRADMKKLMQDFNNQAAEARAVLAKQDNEIKERNDENESLKTALNNQEQFTKTICEQNNALQEKIAILEDEQSALVKVNVELKLQVEEASALNRNLQSNITILNDEKQNLLQEIQGTLEIQKKLDQEILDLKTAYSTLDAQKADLNTELNKAIEECTNKAIEIENLTEYKISLENKLAELEANFQMHKDISDKKVKELNSLLEEKIKEIDSKASTVNQLMSELKTSTDIRSKLELALQKMSKEFEMEREATREKEKKMTITIGQLESVVRNKDDELSKQMSIILEMRNEKERLQEKIQSMQNTIDNIQKELTRPSPKADTATREQPEQDDNAVMLTPSNKVDSYNYLQDPDQTQLMQPSSPILSNVTEFAKPRAQEPKIDNMLYNLFSDSSMDGDSLDSSEVTRRFNALARGERLAPVPLAALKRRCDDKETRKTFLKEKNDIKNKERKFLKNKRLDNSSKRPKFNNIN